MSVPPLSRSRHCHTWETKDLHPGSLPRHRLLTDWLPLLKVYNQPFGLGPLKQSPKLQLTFWWVRYLADKMMTWLLAQPETWLRVEWTLRGKHYQGVPQKRSRGVARGGVGGGSPLMRDQQLQAKILRQRSKQMETKPVLRETFFSATHNLH